MCDILKVSGLVFEMVNGLEMYIIYCIILVGMVILGLRRMAACLFGHGPVIVPVLAYNVKNLDTQISISCTENSGVFTLWLGPDGISVSKFASVSKFVRPPPFAKAPLFNLANVLDIFISKFHELVIVYIRCIRQIKPAGTCRDIFLPDGPTVQRILGQLIGI
jgi:hypothetical protein